MNARTQRPPSLAAEQGVSGQQCRGVGHQSLIVRRLDGAVIVAGQSHDTATQYAADQLAWRAQRDAHGQPLPGIPDWIDASSNSIREWSTSPTTAPSGPPDGR